MFHESGTFDSVALEIYNELMIRNGEVIFRKRREFVHDFVPVFQGYYSFIVANEPVEIAYESGLNSKSFAEGLSESLRKDQVLLRTNFGIHKDDYTFKLGPGDLKRLGSQGQQKSFVIALKLAQHKTLSTHKGFNPIMLLDDIFDKLDDFRIAKLIELIHDDKGQIFLTDARPDRTKNLLKGIDVSASLFDVDEGHLRPNEKEG
jgi:DNA replication and repair protein RecF